MEFKIGSQYTRKEIYRNYFNQDLEMRGSGNWLSGYVRVDNELIIFMNIDVPGRTGHDFPNKFNPVTNQIEWYGKPRSNSSQPTFQKLKNNEYIGHFFARWSVDNPFTYLGIGENYQFEDGHPTIQSNGVQTETVKVILNCNNARSILSDTSVHELPESKFSLEKHLEEFIVTNWESIDLGQNYDLVEEIVDGRRKKFRTDTGEIDIFAKSRDNNEYLVIELKRGRASYSVVGQIQSYMGYIKNNLANENQTVKGIIIV